MEVKKLLVIGLPEAGKTTFLAALWHVVDSAEVDGSLVVSEVHGVRDHLNMIRAEWQKCRELDRTSIPAERIVSFKLRDPETSSIVELSLPDLSGETFRMQWENRQWTVEFDKLARECSGGLLFVHPNGVVEPQRINSTVDAMAAARVGKKETENRDSGVASSTPWSSAHAPTQVKLIEILQFLKTQQLFNRPFPLAIVVSAWDLITTKELPSEWVHNRSPLLEQFLLT